MIESVEVHALTLAQTFLHGMHMYVFPLCVSAEKWSVLIHPLNRTIYVLIAFVSNE